jgi:putative component of membrane protein insertase Oxa1/YidC/SpoIIIJ protein YidD
MSRIAILAIWAYQKTFSPILYLLGVRCRFYAPCSAYAIIAFGENEFLLRPLANIQATAPPSAG